MVRYDRQLPGHQQDHENLGCSVFQNHWLTAGSSDETLKPLKWSLAAGGPKDACRVLHTK